MFSSPVTNCRMCVLGAASERCPFTPMQSPAGSLLCSQGEIHSQAYFVRDGLVAVSAVDASGNEANLSLRGPRAFLCFESMSATQSPYEVRTLSDAKLCSISADEMTKWLGPEQSPARAVTSLLLGELGMRTDDQNLLRGSSLSRVARFALAHSSDTGIRGLKKQLAARMLGMRAETFSRCLTRLADRGFITRGRHLRVLDPTALAAVAASTDAI